MFFLLLALLPQRSFLAGILDSGFWTGRRPSTLRRLQGLPSECMPPRRSRRLACASVFLDLPEHLAAHVLLGATEYEDLLLHAAMCAQVCQSWRRVVSASAAYGGGCAADEAGRAERARVLRQISGQLRAAGTGSGLSLALQLSNVKIGDQGGCTLGAALQVKPAPLSLHSIYLNDNGLTANGLRPIATAVRRGFAGEGLRVLSVRDNPNFSDEGLALLADGLPLTLEVLVLCNTGCGDGGMVAMVAALPAVTSLRALHCGANPAVGQAGWAALGEVLPQLPRLQKLDLRGCAGLGDGGVAVLAPALPRAVSLHDLNLSGCNIGDAGAVALAAVLSDCIALIGTLRVELHPHIMASDLANVVLHDNLYGVTGRAALDAHLYASYIIIQHEGHIYDDY